MCHFLYIHPDRMVQILMTWWGSFGEAQSEKKKKDTLSGLHYIMCHVDLALLVVIFDCRNSEKMIKSKNEWAICFEEPWLIQKNDVENVNSVSRNPRKTISPHPTPCDKRVWVHTIYRLCKLVLGGGTRLWYEVGGRVNCRVVAVVQGRNTWL